MIVSARMASSAFTDQLTAWSTFGMAVFTLLLFGGAVAAWRVGKKALDASREASDAAKNSANAALAANDQARIDSIEQTRPYVFVEFVPGLANLRAWDIRISNSGRSAARELELFYDCWPTELDMVSRSVKELFETSRTLPPGCHIRAYWRVDDGPDGQRENPKEVLGLGRKGVVRVRYTSDDLQKATYEDQFEVSIDNSGLWPVGETGPDVNGLRGAEASFYRLGQVLIRRITELGR